jgi:hypothetical protein
MQKNMEAYLRNLAMVLIQRYFEEREKEREHKEIGPNTHSLPVI